MCFDKKRVKPAGYGKEMYSTFPTGLVIYGFIATLGFGGRKKKRFLDCRCRKKLQKIIQKIFKKSFFSKF
jgi:hypothetical protein